MEGEPIDSGQVLHQAIESSRSSDPNWICDPCQRSQCFGRVKPENKSISGNGTLERIRVRTILQSVGIFSDGLGSCGGKLSNLDLLLLHN